MLNGSLNISHPSLKVSPKIQSLIGQNQTTQVLLFDSASPNQLDDLGSLLNDCANFNRDSKSCLQEATAKYRASRSGAQSANTSNPVLSSVKNPAVEQLQQAKSSRRQQWSNLTQAHSESNLKLAQGIASTVNLWLGPCLLTQWQEIDNGISQLKFCRQTTAESIFDPFTSPNPITGDYFNPKEPERSKLGSALSQASGEVLFSENSSNTVLLDAANGALFLVPPNPK